MARAVAAAAVLALAILAARGTCRRNRRRLGSHCGRRRRRLAGQQLLEPRPEAAAVCRRHGLHSRGRGSGGRRRRGRTHGGRGRRQQRCHRRCLGHGLLILGTRLNHRWGDRHEVGGLFVLRQFHLIVTHASDRVLRGLDVLVRDDDELGSALILERAQPVALLVHEVGGDGDGNLGHDARGAVLAQFLADQAQHRERHRLDAADAADAYAARTDDVAGFPERGPQALSRHLEQAEARQAADLDARTIHFHGVAQAVLDLALILRGLHVDEVDDDQATDVTDTQLPGDLIGGFQVGIGRRSLDVRAARGTRGVDVDRHQRLGVIDDDAATGGQRDLVRVGRLDLALDLEAGEERDFVGVHLQLALSVRRHEALHVLLGLLEGALVIHQYLADVIGEIVAHGAGDRIALAEHQERRRAVLGGRVDLVPLGLEVIKVPLQLLDRAPDAGGAHDGAHAVRDLQLAHDLAHLVAVLALDAARNAPGARVIRHQHQEAPGEADEGGERCALGAAFLLLHLHDELLALVQELTDVHPAALGLLPEVFLGDFLQRQETMTLRAIVNEAGLERGLDAGNLGLVNVSFFLLAGR